MAWFQRPNGTIYCGDRQINPDGVWDEEVPEPEPTIVFNWVGLEQSLRNTSLFGKLLGSSNVNGKVMAIRAFDSTHNSDQNRLDDLMFGISEARSGMAEDYTELELQSFRDKLTAANFPNDWI